MPKYSMYSPISHPVLTTCCDARLRSASRHYNNPLHPTSLVGIRVARAL